MMKLDQLKSETINAIKKLRYDRCVGKHEGPESWDSEFQYGDPEILTISGQLHVLLPIDKSNHGNLSVVRQNLSADRSTLVLFMIDKTYCQQPEDYWCDAGRIAICDRMIDEDLYVAIVYHEWLMTFGLT